MCQLETQIGKEGKAEVNFKQGKEEKQRKKNGTSKQMTCSKPSQRPEFTSAQNLTCPSTCEKGQVKSMMYHPRCTTHFQTVPIHQMWESQLHHFNHPFGRSDL